ncbi:hypothetical protein CLV63_102410 [Murinocardiopsis flavida]|uniref:Concanavalin A-like lectin/glucanase superfamily protein n=1 Tax=Murinocardiopsis flavida TaxID=645275 RepID=A0A2P8DSU1_9ACTN|nr:hypothetical protein [Murinocardiopsis flavida]PSL00283.1 hypothetical protein CLV63_102410 [Murinocardiopsis flavida]
MTAYPRRPHILAPAAAAALLGLTLAAAPDARAAPERAGPAGAPAPRSETNGTVPMADAEVSERGGRATVEGATGPEHWAPVTPEKWDFPGSEVVLTEAGTDPGPPRRPYEYAVLTAGPRFGEVRIDAEVRIDEPVEVDNRDVVVLFGYRSPTEFYYAHLSQDNTIYPHNGIFKVDGADRERIDDQWDGEVGAPPAITDAEYHPVSVRHDPRSGRIAVFVDGAKRPLMTAKDRTFDSGRVGFGSFDNYGRLRALKVTGRPA